MSNFKKFFVLLMAVIFLPLFTHAQTANCSPTITAQINTVQKQITYYQGIVTRLQAQLATLQAKCNTSQTSTFDVTLWSSPIDTIISGGEEKNIISYKITVGSSPIILQRFLVDFNTSDFVSVTDDVALYDDTEELFRYQYISYSDLLDSGTGKKRLSFPLNWKLNANTTHYFYVKVKAKEVVKNISSNPSISLPINGVRGIDATGLNQYAPNTNLTPRSFNFTTQISADLTALKNQAKQLLAQFNTLNCVTEMSYFDIDGATDKTALMNYIQQLQSKIASCQNQTTCVKEGGTYQWSSRSSYDMRNQCCEGLKPMNTNTNIIGAGTSYCSSKCGNGTCESGYYENRVTCYQDCGSIVPPSAAINITPTNSGWLWPTKRTVSFSWTSTNPPANSRVNLYVKKVAEANINGAAPIPNPKYTALAYMQTTTGRASFGVPTPGVWEIYAVICPSTNLYCKPDITEDTNYFTVTIPSQIVSMNNPYTASLENAIRQLQQQLLQMQGR